MVALKVGVKESSLGVTVVEETVMLAELAERPLPFPFLLLGRSRSMEPGCFARLFRSAIAAITSDADSDSEGVEVSSGVGASSSDCSKLAAWAVRD